MSQVYPESPRSPGHLLAPLGWAVKPLVSVLEHDPSLYRALFGLSRSRLHIIGLALAHWECEPDPSLGRLLITGSTRAILDAVLGRRPVGLQSAMNRLPGRVLSRKGYRQLLELLDDPTINVPP